MKNLKKVVLLAVILAFVGLNAYAQKGSSFGFKGGLNYGANGDYFQSIGDNARNPDENIGYHLGIFGKIGDRLYFRPELVYTATKSSYDDDDFQIKKIDAPLLVGLKVLGPVSVFAGPSVQYILDTEFEGIDINDVSDDLSIGLNFGIGVNFNKIGIDLRYERGFSDNEASFITDNLGNVTIDTRPEQLILSLSVAL
ncbi:hypothetical protein BWZ20_03955 [Winogradskyella sp. J14-2]|uniref:outer membrane beta-barrel protein n=1 Tax=Winogradskyella sp. J14-2 TaxID=1936080 RepID=UPI0009729FEC|nr:outer membrane beta-barrel protein [Winogradskyella sp. J14-2]APY07501.1 hypothetical protein BWZ20_03955 [Winogradskyella sp. J14-2]